MAGGKRLRPVLTVLAAQHRRQPDATDEVVLGGVACELVHLGSLYHDDVMDEAEMRRTVESVNARWGNLRAILAGDFLLARASEIAASLGTEVAGLLARTIGRLCEGQIAELRHAYDPSRPVDAYVESIGGKTASLFSAACRIGGIVAELPPAEIEALTAFGHAYGMVFQVADDVLDLTATEEELGKPAGHDLVEGVYTLPVILTLAAGGTAAEELGDLLGQAPRRRRARQGAGHRAVERRRWPRRSPWRRGTSSRLNEPSLPSRRRPHATCWPPARPTSSPASPADPLTRACPLAGLRPDRSEPW